VDVTDVSLSMIYRIPDHYRHLSRPRRTMGLLPDDLARRALPPEEVA
jgi:hypothetical protein